MSARNPRIHGTGEPWATVAWALVGVACAPLAQVKMSDLPLFERLGAPDGGNEAGDSGQE